MQAVVRVLRWLFDWLKWILIPSNYLQPAVCTSEVAELIIYPVKACRGITVKRARISPTGTPCKAQSKAARLLMDRLAC